VLGTDPLGRSILGNTVYDPTTARLVNGQSVTDPFPNNTVPVARFDPVAVKLQNLVPQPTNPSLLANNYQQQYLSERVTNIPSIKIDQLIGSKDKLSFYWSMIHTFAGTALEPTACLCLFQERLVPTSAGIPQG